MVKVIAIREDESAMGQPGTIIKFLEDRFRPPKVISQLPAFVGSLANQTTVIVLRWKYLLGGHF
jgi:hypothetical protein